MESDSDTLAAYRELIADVYELAGTSRSSSDQFAERHDQTAARWHILSVVSEGPLTVPRIADRLGLTRQSIQRVVNGLAVDRLVVLADNPDHQRSRRVVITASGTTIASRLFEESSEYRVRALESAGISASELDGARRTIQRLMKVVDGSADSLEENDT